MASFKAFSGLILSSDCCTDLMQGSAAMSTCTVLAKRIPSRGSLTFDLSCGESSNNPFMHVEDVIPGQELMADVQISPLKQIAPFRSMLECCALYNIEWQVKDTTDLPTKRRTSRQTMENEYHYYHFQDEQANIHMTACKYNLIIRLSCYVVPMVSHLVCVNQSAKSKPYAVTNMQVLPRSGLVCSLPSYSTFIDRICTSLSSMVKAIRNEEDIPCALHAKAQL